MSTDPAVDFEAAIRSLKERLLNDQIGSCSCGKGGIKTPETKYHAPRCAYRVAREQYEAIEHLEAQRPAPSPAAADGTDWTSVLRACAERFQSRPVWKWLKGSPAENDVPVIAATLVQEALAAERAARAAAEDVVAKLDAILGMEHGDAWPEMRAKALGRLAAPSRAEWRCEECGCQSRAFMDERQPNGRFAPGPSFRCANCKRETIVTPSRAEPAYSAVEKARRLADQQLTTLKAVAEKKASRATPTGLDVPPEQGGVGLFEPGDLYGPPADTEE